MDLPAWHTVVTPREEVRLGRSFDPNEFAIHLEQVISGIAPEDYKEPGKFFSRTYFTQALREHSQMVLRRLDGQTTNTAPVLTLVTQFGGGKTHTLTCLYHLIKNPAQSIAAPGVAELLQGAGLSGIPIARTGVFVGNAWDPQPGRETPWIDLARQLAGENGVAILGPAALTAAPGTETLGRLFEAAGGSVLVLFDEVLNFINRHRPMAESFYAFIQNLTVAMTGTTHSAAIISLPRSQTEMTDFDLQWQERITKVVHRVSKDLIANDETEISEVVRRRLFEELGPSQSRRLVAKAYADWCFERRAQLPPEWTAVDTAITESSAREFLQRRFENCYPFHPATLSVFQRKWMTLSQFQQTRSTLAMLAQWISWAFKDNFLHARKEPLITLGSAPLEVADFRSVVLSQLGEARLGVAINWDISGEQSHARVLDVDTQGPLKDIHRRVGTAILFESSGGQADKLAHLPELRFALGEPLLDTTTIDNAAFALENKAFYIRKAGSDGFRIRHQASLKKVVNDRRASLDADLETKPEIKKLVKAEFEKGKSIPVIYFPTDSTDIADTPKLTLIVMDPESEWRGEQSQRQQTAEWTRLRGESPRLYPGALVWCFRKSGKELRTQVEEWLAWKKVKKDLDDGVLGQEIERGEPANVDLNLRDAQSEAKEEVWAGYRYIVVADSQEEGGLRVIDLAPGHTGGQETLCGRIIASLKTENLLNESIGAGYLDRHWPPALKDSGMWSLAGLRKSFLDGSLTRLLDPDSVLRAKIVEFIKIGELGLASGLKADGSFERVWFTETVPYEEVVFDVDVYLLRKVKAQELKAKPLPTPIPPEGPQIPFEPEIMGGSGDNVPEGDKPSKPVDVAVAQGSKTIHLQGMIPSEMWNRLGTKIIPKMKSGTDLKVGIEFTAKVETGAAQNLVAELRQILEDLGVTEEVKVEVW